MLDRSKKVSDRAAAALKCLPAMGVKVIIASARPPRSVRAIYHELGLDTWQINYNGALIWDEPTLQPVFHRPMHARLVQMMIERSRDMFEEVLVSCEILDKWYTDRDEHTYTTETGRLFKPDFICDIEQICSQPITKLMFLGDPRIISRLESLLLEEFGGKVTILHTDEDLLQIMDNRCEQSGRTTKDRGPLSHQTCAGDGHRRRAQRRRHAPIRRRCGGDGECPRCC